MKKSILTLAMASAVILGSSSSFASDVDGLGVAVNYGLFSGATLEMSYPINDTFQVRGALSNGMGISETEEGDTDEEIDYAVEADGGIHRLAFDYHPFDGSFFLSAGYAVNNFSFDTSGTGTVSETVEIGDDEYVVTEDLTLNGGLDWDNGPTLSFGWGHSPAEGWGAMLEIGAIFTGAPNVSLTATGELDGQDVNDYEEVQDSLNDEEQKLKDDVADFTILPIFQAGITYRF